MQWVVLLTSVLVLLSTTTVELVRSESASSASSRQKGAVFQAAEAGMDDFLAKLTDDKTYYFRNVHPAESTRRPTTGADVDSLPGGSCTVDAAGKKRDAANALIPATAWSGSITWTYPNGKDNWCAVSLNGKTYEYNLQITPPSASNLNVRVVATGRPRGARTSPTGARSRSGCSSRSVSDFQMITTDDYTVGATATTNGKIYSSHDIHHSGTATADVFAENLVNPSCCGSFNLVAPAKTYDKTNIRTMIKNPIDFNTFTGSLDDIQRASQAAGTYLDATPDTWKLVFSSSGTYTKQACTNVDGPDSGTTPDDPGSHRTLLRRSPGPVHRSGERCDLQREDRARLGDGQRPRDGRVELRHRRRPHHRYQTIGDDVLGLIAKNDIIVAKYTPYDLTWRAAVIAQNGARHSWDSSGDHGTANHYGSTASNQQPFMDMFDTRNYYYDDACSTCHRRGSLSSTRRTTSTCSARSLRSEAIVRGLRRDGSSTCGSVRSLRVSHAVLTVRALKSARQNADTSIE